VLNRAEKNMSEELVDRIEALRIVAGTVLDAVVALDSAGAIVEWNQAAVRIFGWSKSEAMGRLMGELIVPIQHRGSHAEGLQRYQQTGEARVVNRRIEITAIDRHGREFPVELAIVPTSANGEAVFVGFLRDISERHEAEEKLILSEESLRLTTEAAEIGTWDLDLNTDTLTWSVRTKAMFGIWSDAPCSMDDFYAGLHPDDREATTEAFAQALDPAVRATYDVQYRTVGKEDGQIRWVAAKGKGLFDESGRCFRAVGTAIDITARKLADARDAFMLELSDLLRGGDAEQALEAVCGLMGRFFGVSRTGYGQLDPIEDVFDYSICWTDGDAPPLLGRFPAHAFGAKIVAKLSRGQTVVVEDLLADPLSDEDETRATASAVDTRAILVVPFVRAGRLRSIVYLNDRVVRHWRPDEIAFMEEVAERTRQMVERGEAEAALRALNATLEARVEARTLELQAAEAALRQAQKMEAIGQLTGGIAHDFNNLLQGITGSLDLVRKRIDQGRIGDLDRFIGGAMTSAGRAAALTHRLLAFARRQPLDPRPVEAAPLIASMEDLLRTTLGKGIELQVSMTGELWRTRCDPNQLESAILNLAINARDAMPDGGTLTISAANVDVGAGRRDMRAGAYVCIAVADTGAGMAAETVARAFEPFFTTKPMGQGTGLGLSMIYGFARQSGGHAQIDSAPGEGTTVKLYLPRHHGEGVDEEAATDAGAAPIAEAGETVLVVEDEAVVRGLIVEVLSDLGYQALEAADGPGGLEILQSDRRIDLLVTDVGLPGLNGRQVADAARALRPGLRVLFMSGYVENVAMASGAFEPGMAMITKPFAMEAMANRIREIIEAP
jgi:PAS domain S-box-containing protein